MQALRERVAPLSDDRYLADDIAAVEQLVSERRIIAALGEDMLLPEFDQ